MPYFQLQKIQRHSETIWALEAQPRHITPLLRPRNLLSEQRCGPYPLQKINKEISSACEAVIFRRTFAHLMMHDSSSLLFILSEWVGGCEGWMDEAAQRGGGAARGGPGVTVCRQTGVAETEGARVEQQSGWKEAICTSCTHRKYLHRNAVYRSQMAAQWKGLIIACLEEALFK